MKSKTRAMMTDTDKKIEALAEDYTEDNYGASSAYVKSHIIVDFKAGAQAGIKLERERSAKLVEALKYYAQSPSPFIVTEKDWDAGLTVQSVALKALAEYQAEGSEDE